MGQLADRQAIHAELERAGAEFAALVDRAGPGDLRRPTDGTRWTNLQLLFHWLFGYLIVRTLLGLVRMFGRLPDSCSRVFAAGLNAGTRPFHAVNYLPGFVRARLCSGVHASSRSSTGSSRPCIDAWTRRRTRRWVA